MENAEATKVEIVQDTKKKSTKKEKTPIKLNTRAMTEEELRKALNNVYGEHNEYFKLINEKVRELTLLHTRDLRHLILSLKSLIKPIYGIDTNTKNEAVQFKNKLSDQELEDFILYLPVEMYSVNKCIEDRALDSEISQFLTDLQITEHALNIVGGTEKERMRAAEYNSMYHSLTLIVKKRVYYNLKSEVDAANKVYEALKKIISVRIDDKKLNAYKLPTEPTATNTKASNSYYR